MATGNDKIPPQVTREQLTDEEWEAAGVLFSVLQRLQQEGKIGRKPA